MSRQSTPLDVQDQDSLARIAKLAAQVMSSLRTPGRGQYSSERVLRSWVSEDGYSSTTADIGPALTLLAATKRIVRPEVAPNTPRPGRLAKGSEAWHSMPASDGAVAVPVAPDEHDNDGVVDLVDDAPESRPVAPSEIGQPANHVAETCTATAASTGSTFKRCSPARTARSAWINSSIMR